MVAAKRPVYLCVTEYFADIYLKALVEELTDTGMSPRPASD